MLVSRDKYIDKCKVYHPNCVDLVPKILSLWVWLNYKDMICTFC